MQRFSYEDISQFLPRYLSEDSSEVMRREIERFTKGEISRSLYTNRLLNEKTIYQGDALEGMLIVRLPDPQINPAKAIILSNTCDIDLNNQRLFDSMVVYSPILDLGKYEQALIKNQVSASKVKAHIVAIRQQIITQIFYLPAGGFLKNDGIVFLDRICSCVNSSIDRSTIKSKRLFTLSDFGHYLFLFKLSLHFTRLTSKVDRGYS
jgi:hypothetical protein